MPRSRPTVRRASTAAAGAGVLALAFAASLDTGTAHATDSGNTRVAVASGTNVSAIPGAKAFGDTDPNTPEKVSFVLKERHKGALEAQVEHGVRHQLNVSQFARTYGQGQRTINEITSYLASFGIKTTVYDDNVDIAASGTAGEFDKALAVQQHNYKVPAQRGKGGSGHIPAQTVHGTAQQPKLPRRVADSVLAVLGLSNYSPFASNAKHINAGVHAKPTATSGVDCTALTGLPSACNTPADYIRRYGLGDTEKAGNTGAGRTVGIVTLAAVDQGAPEHFWSDVMHLPDTGRTVSVQDIDGGPGAPSDAAGTGETDLDVEQSGGVAPGANVTVYQAPNTDNGFADAFFTAASQNTADSVSASWGESETIIKASVASGVETPQYQAAFDEAFLEMGAQGQSVFASAGDEGAYDASSSVDLGTTNLAVDSPADSPFITSAGGTTLPWSATLTSSTGTSANVSVSDERAWGWDYLWSPLAKLHGTTEAAEAVQEIGGGGGGYSEFEPEPSYQRRLVGSFSAVHYLTPTDYQSVSGITEPTSWSFTANPSVTTGHGSGRAEPDLSADGDPYTGYLLYEPSAGAGNELQGGWGGTSFVAPQLNGSAAVIDQAVGHRVGFLNPIVYGLAAGKKSPLNALSTGGTSNDNLYYTGTPGSRYNPATGLGTPDFGGIIAQLRHR